MVCLGMISYHGRQAAAPERASKFCSRNDFSIKSNVCNSNIFTTFSIWHPSYLQFVNYTFFLDSIFINTLTESDHSFLVNMKNLEQFWYFLIKLKHSWVIKLTGRNLWEHNNFKTNSCTKVLKLVSSWRNGFLRSSWKPGLVLNFILE